MLLLKIRDTSFPFEFDESGKAPTSCRGLWFWPHHDPSICMRPDFGTRQKSFAMFLHA